MDPNGARRPRARRPFAYNSLANDVLGWVLARRQRTPLRATFLESWSAIGPEQDAEIMLDHRGFPIVEGGICATLRDVARFGLMCLQDGSLGGKQILPAGWIGRQLVRDEELIDAYGVSNELGGPAADAFYHDNWWIWDAHLSIRAAVGMNGQSIFVHRPSRTMMRSSPRSPRRSTPTSCAPPRRYGSSANRSPDAYKQAAKSPHHVRSRTTTGIPVRLRLVRLVVRPLLNHERPQPLTFLAGCGVCTRRKTSAFTCTSTCGS